MFCKECGEEIPEDATICPNCGVTVISTTNSESKDAADFYKKIAIVLAIVVVCLVIGGVIMMSNSNNSGQNGTDINLIKISTSGYTTTSSNKTQYCYRVEGVVKNLPNKGEGYSLKGAFYDQNGNLIREEDSFLGLDYCFNSFEKSEPEPLLIMSTNSLVNVSRVEIVIYGPDGDIVYNESVPFKMENFKLN